MSLFIGFIASLFHLFTFLKAFEICFLFIPILLTLILFRFKSILNASINLFAIFISLLIISKFINTNSITNISDIYLNNFKANQSLASDENIRNDLNRTCLNLQQNQSSSSIFNLFSYNLFTFLCFLLTFYLKSLLSIYYCSLTSLERWNISFLCKLSFWRKLSIFITFIVYLIFILTCTITLCIKFKSWSFLVLPFFFIISFIWCCFELLNTINLTHLMNKISDCYLMLNESNSVTNSDNTSNLLKRSHNSNNNNNINNNPLLDDNSLSNSNNRVSTLSHSSSNNNNKANNYSKFKLTKFLSRFLSYNKLHLYGNNSINQLNSINIPIHRILAYKGVRNLGSISYRISLYCFTQTVLLAIFTINTNSPFTIGIYLISLSLNFIWISLLYQFCKSVSGNCIAYALVAPPHILNQNNGSITNTFGTNTTNSSVSSNPTLFSSKKYRSGSSTATSYTTGTTINTATTSSSLMYMPFNYQQAINQRCAYILLKMQAFFQFHLIENYGCDFASNGLTKEYLELKIKNFFHKKSLDGSPFNTYMLYYCGPTSSQTDNLSFLDGNELSIEEIINVWKEINCNIKKPIIKKEESNSDSDTNIPPVAPAPVQVKKKINSRLIIILDSEHTAKSLDYINQKCNESNVYVALQTAKYNFNNQKNRKLNSTNDKCDNSNSKQTISPNVSPKTLAINMFDSYSNIGKFTLDWIKSNFCNSNEYFGNDDEKMNSPDAFYLPTIDLNDEKEKINELDEDEEDEDDDSDNDIDFKFNEKQATSTINRTKKSHSHSSNVFYEAKCAFSRYWIDFSFDSNQKLLAQDFCQFWRSYYPYFICRPLLKLINCRLFYLKLDVFKRVLFYLRRLKSRLIPISEYDTGHGFKLFSS